MKTKILFFAVLIAITLNIVNVAMPEALNLQNNEMLSKDLSVFEGIIIFAWLFLITFDFFIYSADSFFTTWVWVFMGFGLICITSLKWLDGGSFLISQIVILVFFIPLQFKIWKVKKVNNQ